VSLLLEEAGPAFVIATVALQVVITFVPVLWLVTWRRRPALGTFARLLAFGTIVIAATGAAIPIERRVEARRHASQIDGRATVLGSIQRVNGSLGFFKRRYGDYPNALSQLDFPPAEYPVDSRHAGLIQFPLPMEDFFDFTYSRHQSDYELRVDGKPGQGWDLYHYCTDASAIVHFDTDRSQCKRGMIIYSKTQR
jgi:hypothetical protein